MARFIQLGLAIAAGLVLVSTAMAGVPDPLLSSYECVIIGTNKGACLPPTPGAAGFEATVRDAGGTPLAGVTVVVDFHDALPGIGAHEDSVVAYTVQPAGVTPCGAGTANTLSAVTDVNGKALFCAQFGGFIRGQRVTVRANGILLSPGTGAACAGLQARSTDFNLDANVTGSDLSTFANGYLNAASYNTYRYVDLNADGAITGGDLTIFANDYIGATAKTFCAGGH